MYIIDCKECGGRNEVNTESNFITCAYCGKQITLPTVKDEERARLFNRANYFRRQGEFDKAIQAFTSIVNQDASDPEATWGRVLARYGIEYVEDPRTGERIPTCNRVSKASILTDSDYLATLDNSKDEYTRSLYVKEAERIDKIQKGILAIAKLEEPFDVFICYKESTGGGSRTEESVLAQDIYDKLTKEGLRVFFSRITLEDKLGQQYEPYIFAALNSAKVMLVVTTDPANVNSAWVKNEWSRYITIARNNDGKMIIPCYKTMDINEMPDELSLYQGINMSSLGALQDLIHVVVKACKRDSKNTVSSAAVTNSNTEALYRRACLFLEDREFAKADEYFDRILDIDPEQAKAYMGKVFAAQKVQNEETLILKATDIFDMKDYEKAIRFANGEEKGRYEEYPERIKKQRENVEKERQYQSIIRDKKCAPGAQQMRRIAARFRELGEYKDALLQAAECEKIASDCEMKKAGNSRETLEQTYQHGKEMMLNAHNAAEWHAIADLFGSLGGYKDSRTLKEKCISKAVDEEKSEYRRKGVCQYCGQSFRGIFNKMCRACGQKKDY